MQAFFSEEQCLHREDPVGWFDGSQSGGSLRNILRALREHGAQIVAPPDYGSELLRAVHSVPYLAFLASAYDRQAAVLASTVATIPTDGLTFDFHSANQQPAGIDSFDGVSTHVSGAGCVFGRGTWRAVQAAAYSAAAAAQHVSGLRTEGLTALAISYPGGYRAHRNFAAAGCFVNNAALAAATLLERFKRVVVLSLGERHADGVQDIFYHRADAMTVSLHSHGAVREKESVTGGCSTERGVGPGYGYNLNFPLVDSVRPQSCQMLKLLDNVLDILHDYRPQAAVVSLNPGSFGPVASAGSEANAYQLGRGVGERLLKLGLPTVLVVETDVRRPDDVARDGTAAFLSAFMPQVSAALRL